MNSFFWLWTNEFWEIDFVVVEVLVEEYDIEIYLLIPITPTNLPKM